MPLSLLVFDCDGVILESVDAKTQAFAQVAERFGPEARDRLTIFHRLHAGVSRRVKFDWLVREFQQRAPAAEELDELCSLFVRHALDNTLRAPLVPGIVQVLDEWKDRVPLCVCSSAPTEEIRNILEKRGLSGYFTFIQGSPPCKARQLSTLVRDARVDPADVVFVGDAGSDMQAAERVGTRFYGRGRDFVGSGYDWGEDLCSLNRWLDAQNEL